MEQMYIRKENQRTLSQEEAERLKEEAAEQAGKTVTSRVITDFGSILLSFK